MLGMAVAPVMAQDEAPAAPEAPVAPAAPVKKAMKAPKKSTNDETGIKKAFAGVSAAWASGDAKKMIKFFTYDSSLINPMGQEGWGKEEVAKIIAADLEVFKGTTQKFDNFKFVWIMPTIALVDCDAVISGMKTPDGMDAGDQKMHVYGEIVNRGKDWQARSIRVTSFMKPPSAAPAVAVPEPAVPAPAASTAPPAPSTADSVPVPVMDNTTPVK